MREQGTCEHRLGNPEKLQSWDQEKAAGGRWHLPTRRTSGEQERGLAKQAAEVMALPLQPVWRAASASP